MKKIFTLLLLAVFCFGCSSDDDNDPDTSKTDPDIPATESLKGQTFYSFVRTEDAYIEVYDVYRVFSFTSDTDVIEHQAKGTPDGDTLYLPNKGKYAYSHPDLQFRIHDNLDFDFIATMNDEKTEFTYSNPGKSYTFKKK